MIVNSYNLCAFLTCRFAIKTCWSPSICDPLYMFLTPSGRSFISRSRTILFQNSRCLTKLGIIQKPLETIQNQPLWKAPCPHNWVHAFSLRGIYQWLLQISAEGRCQKGSDRRSQTKRRRRAWKIIRPRPRVSRRRPSVTGNPRLLTLRLLPPTHVRSNPGAGHGPVSLPEAFGYR